ncbi:type II and III secretion system protein family protein [Ponticaulis profundi]|uniref:Type II and III secretion system protein family protein n=1 Tax=Ponticaulis profundi TaxID=2665222 RepID=A0ABW1S920_9PROT
MIGKMIGPVLTAGLLALSGLGGLSATAQSNVQVAVSESGKTPVTRNLLLPVNKSSVIELPVPAADVIVTNPAIADAVVRTSQRVIFRGVSTGETNAFFFDIYGNQILDLQIRVEQDLTGLDDLYRRLLPDARINVEASNGAIILTGRVANAAESMRAVELAQNFVVTASSSSGSAGSGGAASGSGGGDESDSKVINLLSVEGKDQVLLKVRIVEMQRTLTKQLGVNLNGGKTVGTNGDSFINDVTFSTTNAFNVAGRVLGGLGIGIDANDADSQFSLGAEVNALERVGLIRTLAEPNLTAISGESAKFLAGGEYPVPVGQDDNGQISLEFKPFGVGLGFTPVVLSEGRISLRISTEVSELTQEGAFAPQSVAGTDANGNVTTVQTINIPALTVRRAETTVELPSGGSTMIAGLIQESTQQTLDSIPGIKNVPILGALFRSRDFQNDETELVVIVTPYLVDPTDPNKLKTPGDGYSTAGDLATMFLGRLNDIYAVPGANTEGETFDAPVGFIIE